METEDIKHLAALARIALTEEEATTLSGEFDDILAYVEQVKEVASGEAHAPEAGPHHTILREDVVTNEPGMYTDALLEAAPEREGRYVKVKKILDHG